MRDANIVNVRESSEQTVALYGTQAAIGLTKRERT